MSNAAPSGSKSTNGAGPGLDREPSHPFVRRLWRAVRQDLEREMNTTLRVAVMLADGFAREEIGRRLDLTPRQIDRVCERIERVADKIDRNDDVPAG
jgi:hypothetical protein